MFKEFREFILKGNMLDLAVGVIIAGAFGKVVTEFTGILLKAIATATGGNAEVKGIMVGGIDFSPFLNSIISLLIVGFALFLVVKAYNTAKKRFEKPAEAAGPAELPADVKLLAEIRDLLKQKP